MNVDRAGIQWNPKIKSMNFGRIYIENYYNTYNLRLPITAVDNDDISNLFKSNAAVAVGDNEIL